MTEQEMIDAIKNHIKIHCSKSRLPNPDYLSTRMYYPQWKGIGDTMFYRLPNKGQIIATFIWTTEGKHDNFTYYPDGITYEDVKKIEDERRVAWQHERGIK